MKSVLPPSVRPPARREKRQKTLTSREITAGAEFSLTLYRSQLLQYVLRAFLVDQYLPRARAVSGAYYAC